MHLLRRSARREHRGAPPVRRARCRREARQSAGSSHKRGRLAQAYSLAAGEPERGEARRTLARSRGTGRQAGGSARREPDEAGGRAYGRASTVSSPADALHVDRRHHRAPGTSTSATASRRRRWPTGRTISAAWAPGAQARSVANGPAVPNDHVAGRRPPHPSATHGSVHRGSPSGHNGTAAVQVRPDALVVPGSRLPPARCWASLIRSIWPDRWTRPSNALQSLKAIWSSSHSGCG